MWNPAKAGVMGTSGSDIWAVLNGSSSLTSRELQGDGIDEHLAYTTSGSNAFWFLSDHLGSIRTVVDSTGAAVHAYSYDAFGNVTSVATPSMYAWTGREFDAETGLQYNRARYYDAPTGRWISLDPMGFDAGDSNLYRYVNNRTTYATDPSGLAKLMFSGQRFTETKFILDNQIDLVLSAGEKNGFAIIKRRIAIAATASAGAKVTVIGISAERFKEEKWEKADFPGYKEFPKGISGALRIDYQLLQVANGQGKAPVNQKGLTNAIPYNIFSARAFRASYFADVESGETVDADQRNYYEARYLDANLVKNTQQLIASFPLRREGMVMTSQMPAQWNQASADGSNGLLVENVVRWTQGLPLDKKGGVKNVTTISRRLREWNGQEFRDVSLTGAQRQQLRDFAGI